MAVVCGINYTDEKGTSVLYGRCMDGAVPPARAPEHWGRSTKLPGTREGHIKDGPQR